MKSSPKILESANLDEISIHKMFSPSSKRFSDHDVNAQVLLNRFHKETRSKGTKGNTSGYIVEAAGYSRIFGFSGT